MKLVSALLAAVVVFAICNVAQMFAPAIPSVLPAVVVGAGVFFVA